MATIKETKEHRLKTQLFQIEARRRVFQFKEKATKNLIKGDVKKAFEFQDRAEFIQGLMFINFN